MLVAVLLLGFVLVAVGVIWRRAAGIAQSRELRDLERRRVQLEALRIKLDGDVRDASSRARLAPVVERRLHMHVPPDSQVVLLPRARAAP